MRRALSARHRQPGIVGIDARRRSRSAHRLRTGHAPQTHAQPPRHGGWSSRRLLANAGGKTGLKMRPYLSFFPLPFFLVFVFVFLLVVFFVLLLFVSLLVFLFFLVVFGLNFLHL